jgi:hypothetical protein
MVREAQKKFHGGESTKKGENLIVRKHKKKKISWWGKHKKISW